MRPIPGERLGDLGAIWVTERAAREYAAARYRIRGEPHLTLEHAHLELAEYLADAKQLRADTRTGASVWRRRTDAMRLDVEAHVDIPSDVDEVRVTHVHVRPYGGRKR